MMIRPADAHVVPVHLRRDLLAEGWHDRAILAMVRQGQWVRVRHGAYCERPVWEALDTGGQHLVRTRAVLLQAKTELVVSHVSALPWYGAPLWEVPLVDVNVTRTDARIGRHEAGVHQHRGRLRPGDVVQVGDARVMSATRVVIEVSTMVSLEAGLVIANYFIREGLTTTAQLDERYHASDLPIVSWPRTLRTDLVIRRARGTYESVGEVRVDHLLKRFNLPPAVAQYEIRTADGTLIARVDFAWPELGVFLEFDGLVKYRQPYDTARTASDVVIAEKRREERICRHTGWRCLRLVWADLETPERTAALIRSFLDARPGAA